MRTAIVKLESVSAYSASRLLGETKGESESWDDFERRIWREKAHIDEEGKVFIPPMAFKQSLDTAAKYLGKMEGKKGGTWTKHFVGGVIIIQPFSLGITKDQLTEVWINAHANGKRGGGTRVRRCFPLVGRWAGELTCLIVDDEITSEAFEKAFGIAGRMVGVGRFRPENGGYLGRFNVLGINWK